MKKFAALICAALLQATAPIAIGATMPDDQKPGYSLGVYMGGQIRSSLESQGLNVNTDAFVKGLSAGVTNATPELSNDDMQKSLSILQAQAQTSLDSKVRTNAAKHAGELFGPLQTLVAGNPKGKVTLVEFSDYECPHCKAMTPIIEQLIESNPDLRVVYRPFPIINANSTAAATAVYAAQAQGKFEVMHSEMMASTEPLTSDKIRTIAQDAKIDPKKFETALKASRIKEELKNNRDLATNMGIRGTPSFLIATSVNTLDDKESWPSADHIYFSSGEVDEAALKEFIDKVK